LISSKLPKENISLTELTSKRDMYWATKNSLTDEVNHSFKY